MYCNPDVQMSAIQMYCNPDVSHKEQMTRIIRYVYINDETCTIEESFVDFIESHQKTGKDLATEISKKYEKDGLQVSDCCGQGYDIDPICLKKTIASKLTSILSVRSHPFLCRLTSILSVGSHPFSL